jgi:uncharacterized membrane protein
MPDMEFALGLIFRWLHILAAITAVGGTIFARVVVFPTLASLPDGERTQLHTALRQRWSTLVKAAIGFLLVSGLYNFLLTVSQYQVPSWYHMVFGVKFLLALAIFAIASLLIGKSPAAQAVRARAPLWLNVNIVLAVAVVCLSGVLRTAEKTPKITDTEQHADAPAER